MEQLLLVIADVKVDLGVGPAELEGGQVIGQRGLLLRIKAAQVDLLSLLPDVRLPPLRPVHILRLSKIQFESTHAETDLMRLPAGTWQALGSGALGFCLMQCDMHGLASSRRLA